MVDRPALLTVADVAARFGVSESTVRVWLTHHDAGATGGVPSILPTPLARGVVWLAEEIEAIAPQVEARSRAGGRPRKTHVDPPEAGQDPRHHIGNVARGHQRIVHAGSNRWARLRLTSGTTATAPTTWAPSQATPPPTIP